MKRMRLFLTGAIVGAGFAAYTMQQHLKTKDARLRQLQAEKEALQTALAAATRKPTAEEAAASFERARRKSAWAYIPRWLELSEDTRRNLILQTAKDGVSDMYPDAEMIAEYHRLKAEGRLNPDDFKSSFEEDEEF